MSNAARFIAITAIPMSAGFTSEAYDFIDRDLFSLQAVWSGADAVDATIMIQGSNNKIDWVDFNSTECAIRLNSAASTDMFDSNQQISCHWLRAVYSEGANTAGTLALYFLIKSSK